MALVDARSRCGVRDSRSASGLRRVGALIAVEDGSRASVWCWRGARAPARTCVERGPVLLSVRHVTVSSGASEEGRERVVAFHVGENQPRFVGHLDVVELWELVTENAER